MLTIERPAQVPTVPHERALGAQGASSAARYAYKSALASLYAKVDEDINASLDENEGASLLRAGRLRELLPRSTTTRTGN